MQGLPNADLLSLDEEMYGESFGTAESFPNATQRPKAWHDTWAWGQHAPAF